MRQRIVLYFVAIALVSIALPTFLSIYQSRQAAERQHVGNSIRLAEALRDNVARVLAQAEVDVRIVARAAEVLAADERSLPEELARLGWTMRDYNDLTVIDEEGVVLASTSFDFHGDWRHQVGFREALLHGEAAAGFHRLPATGQLALAFYASFHLPEGRRGVAALQLDAVRIDEIPRSIGEGMDGPLAFIVDERGRFVAHPMSAYVMEQTWPSLTSQIRGASGRISFSMYGRAQLGGFAVLPQKGLDEDAELPGWAVVVAEDEALVFGFLRSTLHTVHLLGIAMFIALAGLGWQLASRIARPIESLVTATEQVGQRDFAVSVSVAGPPEVARLAAAFNHMVGEIGEYQARLSASEQRYRDLADLLPQTVFEADERGVFTYVNRAGLAMFGYSEEEALGHRDLTLLDTLVPEDRARAAEVWRRLFAGARSLGNRYRARRRDGGEVPIVIYSAAYETSPGRWGLRGIVIDVSELERKDTIIRQAQRLETIGLLAGGLAHDLNNVLGGILGAVGLIRHHLQPQRFNVEEVRRMLDLVDGSVARAADMVQKLLAMSRRKDLSLTPVDLNIAVEHVAAVCRGTFERSVEIDAQPALTLAVVRADASQLEQVLMNLAINAYHAVTIMRSDEQKLGARVSMRVRRERVEEENPPLGLAPGLVVHTGDYWVMSVSDNGVGIPEDAVAQVFEPFFSTKQAGQGSGLGLAVIHSIAQQTNGLVTVRSTVGEGTTFEVYLPVCEDSLPSARDWPLEEAPAKGRGRILVVDDDAIIQRTTAMMLSECGYEVEVVSGGKEALTAIAADPARFDLVLADLSMPQMSGKELLTEVRRLYPTLRCALMTGHMGDSRVADIEKLGVGFVLAKPFDLNALAEKLSSVLGS